MSFNSIRSCCWALIKAFPLNPKFSCHCSALMLELTCHYAFGGWHTPAQWHMCGTPRGVPFNTCSVTPGGSQTLRQVCSSPFSTAGARHPPDRRFCAPQSQLVSPALQPRPSAPGQVGPRRPADFTTTAGPRPRPPALSQSLLSFLLCRAGWKPPQESGAGGAAPCHWVGPAPKEQRRQFVSFYVKTPRWNDLRVSVSPPDPGEQSSFKRVSLFQVEPPLFMWLFSQTLCTPYSSVS